MKVQERRERGANDTVESQKPCCFPMAPETGRWAKYRKLPGKKVRTAAPRSGSPAPALSR
jgi:hypothetical protein